MQQSYPSTKQTKIANSPSIKNLGLDAISLQHTLESKCQFLTEEEYNYFFQAYQQGSKVAIPSYINDLRKIHNNAKVTVKNFIKHFERIKLANNINKHEIIHAAILHAATNETFTYFFQNNLNGYKEETLKTFWIYYVALGIRTDWRTSPKYDYSNREQFHIRMEQATEIKPSVPIIKSNEDTLEITDAPKSENNIIDADGIEFKPPVNFSGQRETFFHPENNQPIPSPLIMTPGESEKLLISLEKKSKTI